MQAAAGSRRHRQIHAVYGSKRVDGNSGAERQAAVIATRAERRGDVLRTVIDGVRVGRLNGRSRRSVGPGPDGLMIHTSRLARALRWEPSVRVIVGEGEFAGHKVELGRKRAVRPAE